MSNSKENKREDALFDKAMTAVAEGRREDALRALKKVVGLKGNFYAKACNQLGLLYLQTRRPVEAVFYFEKAGPELKDTPAFQMNYARALLGAGQPEKAIAFLKPLGAKGDLQTLGEALTETGDFEGAIKAFEEALSKGGENAETLLDLAFAKKKAGQDAKGELDKAKALAPDLYVKYYQAAEKFYDNNAPKEALVLLEKSTGILPKDPIPHHMFAVLYQNLGEKDLAEDFLKKSIEIAPTPESYGQLAALYEKANQLNDAWATSSLGLRLFPGDGHLTLTLARIERRAKKLDQALARLTKLEGTTGDDKLEGQLQFQLGWLYDKNDKVEEAFACYSKGKALAARTEEAGKVDKSVTFHYIDQMKKLDLGALKTPAWRPAKGEPKNVAFLVGFPRSGTTLLNQILDAHPNLVSLEEVPTLPGPAAVVEELEGGYPAALTDLDEDQIELMRTLYFHQVRQFADYDEDSILIDKLPLNLVHLPLVKTMFPKARIILALRHPLGAILSNFMHSFKLNNAMANMFTLEDIAALYEATLGLWQKYREDSLVDWHAIKYENIVGDLEGEAKKLCDFLGVEWSKDMLGFSKHAQKKGLINTPSYHQVSQPLYADSLERWRRYETYLTPIRGKIDPFIDDLGYAR